MILIVADSGELARIWDRHLQRQNNHVTIATSETEAIDALRDHEVGVVVLDLMLEDGSAFLIADYASYRQPNARIVFVTKTGFFSDGSLFKQVPNTAAILQANAAPSDVAEIVSYYGRAS